MSSAGCFSLGRRAISGVAKTGVSQSLACLPTVMLKKIFAKLRETISPSRAKKPVPTEAAKPVSHGKSPSGPHRGEGRQERGAGRGQGARPHDKYRGQPRDPRDEPQREPRAGGAGHEGRP